MNWSITYHNDIPCRDAMTVVIPSLIANNEVTKQDFALRFKAIQPYEDELKNISNNYADDYAEVTMQMHTYIHSHVSQ